MIILINEMPSFWRFIAKRLKIRASLVSKCFLFKKKVSGCFLYDNDRLRGSDQHVKTGV